MSDHSTPAWSLALDWLEDPVAAERSDRARQADQRRRLRWAGLSYLYASAESRFGFDRLSAALRSAEWAELEALPADAPDSDRLDAWRRLCVFALEMPPSEVARVLPDGASLSVVAWLDRAGIPDGVRPLDWNLVRDALAEPQRRSASRAANARTS